MGNKLFIISFLIGAMVIALFEYEVHKTDKEVPTILIKSEVPYEHIGSFEITYYTHTGNRTSTMVYPKPERTIAVDPKVIPYGTMLYVEGEGFYIAEDCGGDIKGNRLDIFVDTNKEAIEKGRTHKKVYKLG